MGKETRWDMIVRKLTSRKMWAAIGNFVGMIMLAKGFPESEVTQAVAIIMAGAGALAYIIAEGFTDAAATDTIPLSEITTDLVIEEEE